jgi:hypothetical protein
MVIAYRKITQDEHGVRHETVAQVCGMITVCDNIKMITQGDNMQ